jgi:hypothetical protein
MQAALPRSRLLLATTEAHARAEVSLSDCCMVAFFFKFSKKNYGILERFFLNAPRYSSFSLMV